MFKINNLINSKENFLKASPLFYAIQNGWFDMAVSLHNSVPFQYDVNESHEDIDLLSVLMEKSSNYHYQSTNENNTDDGFKDYINDFFNQHFSHYKTPDEETSIDEKAMLYFYYHGAKPEQYNYQSIKNAISKRQSLNNFISIVFEDIGWKNLEQITFENEGIHYPILHWLNINDFNKNKKLIEQMKKNGYNLNIKDSQNKSAIFSSSNIHSVNFFLENEVDLFVKNQPNINALEIGQNIFDNNERHLALKNIKKTIKEKYKDKMSDTTTESTGLEILKNELIKDVSNTEFKKFYKANKPSDINTTFSTKTEDITLFQSGILEIENRKKHERSKYSPQAKLDNILTNIDYLLKKKSKLFQKNNSYLIEQEHSPDTLTGLIYILSQSYSNIYSRTQRLEKAINSIDDLIISQSKKPSYDYQNIISIEDYKNSLAFFIEKNKDKDEDEDDNLYIPKKENSLLLYKTMISSCFFHQFNNSNDNIVILNNTLDNIFKKTDELLNGNPNKNKNVIRNLNKDINVDIDLTLCNGTWLSVFDNIHNDVKQENVNQFCNNVLLLLQTSQQTNLSIKEIQLNQLTALLMETLYYHDNLNDEQINFMIKFKEHIVENFSEKEQWGMRTGGTLQDKERAKKKTETIDIMIDKVKIEKISRSTPKTNKPQKVL